MRLGRSPRAKIAALFSIVVCGCGQGADPTEIASVAPSGSAEAAPDTIGAREFCQLLYGDLAKELDSECGAGSPDRPSGADALRDASDKCMTQLDASVVSGRLRISKPHADLCAKTLKAAYREGVPLRAPIDLAGFEGCAGLFEGELPSGSSCRTALECKSPLVCKAPDGVDKPFEGTCSDPAPAGARCWPYNEAILLGARPPCADGLYCPGEAKSSDWGSIGLGSIGTIGHGAGTGSGGGSSLGGGYAWQVAHGKKPKPAPTIKMGGATVTGRLPPEVIQRIVRRNFGRFRACYEAGLKADPKLEGRIAVKFTIDPKGAVKSVADAGSTLPDKSVVQCVIKPFSTFLFPEPEGGSVQVTFPMVFAPPAQPGAAPSAPEPAPPPAGLAEPPLGELWGGSPPEPAEPGIVEGAWRDHAPKPGVCRARAPKGHGCLTSDGCGRGLVCVAAVCVDPAAGQALACQSDRDCSVWQRCKAEGFAQAGAAFGLCVDRKPAKAACERSDECRGSCVAFACDQVCSQK